MGSIRWRWVTATVVVVAMLAPHGIADAASFDPGDFSVTMASSSGMANQRPATTCDVAGQSMPLQTFLDNVAGTWNGQGTAPTAVCSFGSTTTLTNADLAGTVTNKTVGAGTITQTCDMRQTVKVKVSLRVGYATGAAGANTADVTSFDNSMEGFRACAWAMDFSDAKDSRLSGTIEQVFGFSSTGSVPCNGEFSEMAGMGTVHCVEVRSDSKVWVVGGAGEFASTAGTGQFSSGQMAPVVIPSFRTVRGQSLGGAARSVEAFARAVIEAIEAASADSGNALKITLMRNAKAKVRLVSPASDGSTRTLGTGPDGASLTKVKAAGAPGAKCGVDATFGKKKVTLLAAKKDSDGTVSTSITAATLKAKVGAGSGAAVKLSVYCAIGKASATTTQTVTVGP